MIAGGVSHAADLEHVSPTNEALSVGLAGEYPADISRYLLANGAQSAEISPDGERIALIRSITGNRQLWVMAADGGLPEQITFGNGVTFFAWTPDGGALLYGADNNGDEQENYYLISADGYSEALVLPAVAGGFRRFGAFSSDGSRFAYASTERNGDDFDIYVHDLQSGISEQVYQGKFGFAVEAWVPNKETLITSENVGEDSDNLYTLDLETGVRSTLYKPDIRATHVSGFGGENAFAFSEDSKQVYFSTNAGREFLALGSQPTDGGRFKIIDEASSDLVSPVMAGGRYLAYVINVDGFDSLRVFDTKRGRQISTPSLPAGVLSISAARDNARIAIRVNAYNRPGDVYLWDIKRGDLDQVFASTLAGLNDADFIKPVSVKIPARDGVMVQALLYLPSGNFDGLPPVLFDVHGGPTSQSRPGFEPVIQYHVSRGVAVVDTNVRGSTGFGRTYLTLDDRKKRLDSVRDLVDILKYFGDTGDVDASRAIVKGGSYGGYMVNAVLGAYPDAFDAGVSLFGVGDWVTALEVASPGLKAADRIEYGDISDPAWREYYTEISPIRNADKINVPVLYSHGARDPRINKAETEIMVRALRKNNVRADYILIPDEGHGWRKLSNRLFYFRREAEFLESIFAN